MWNHLYVTLYQSDECVGYMMIAFLEMELGKLIIPFYNISVHIRGGLVT